MMKTRTHRRMSRTSISPMERRFQWRTPVDALPVVRADSGVLLVREVLVAIVVQVDVAVAVDVVRVDRRVAAAGIAKQSRA
jgi:hypothetical protein